MSGQELKELKQRSWRNSTCWIVQGLQDALLRAGSAHSGKDPPPSISNQDKASRTRPQTSLMEATPYMKFPLPTVLNWQPSLAITEHTHAWGGGAGVETTQ